MRVRKARLNEEIKKIFAVMRQKTSNFLTVWHRAEAKAEISLLGKKFYREFIDKMLQIKIRFAYELLELKFQEYDEKTNIDA